MAQQFADKQVEPNGRLGQAFNYLLKRGEALTGFLRIPGAPPDNHPAEQAQKLSVRYRKNSLFDKHQHGASVGDVPSRLIETCRLNAVIPIDDLSALPHNRSALFADPTAWLPRNALFIIPPTAVMPRPASDRVVSVGVAVGVAVAAAGHAQENLLEQRGCVRPRSARRRSCRPRGGCGSCARP